MFNVFQFTDCFNLTNNMRSCAIIVFSLLILIEGTQAQKGEISISAGPLISFPFGSLSSSISVKPGIGLEAVGQYYFSNRSALLFQTSWALYNANNPYSTFEGQRLSIFSINGGYQYNFSALDFFANLLTGFDKDSDSPLWSPTMRLGAGKRFALKNDHFLNAGVDYVFGDTFSRINLKALISLFQKP